MADFARLDLDVAQIVLQAKLGRTRKDAQVDTCTVFSAALFDVLTGVGISCEVWNALYCLEPLSSTEWGHSVVKVNDLFYDSLGLFNHEIVRARVKVHPKIRTRLRMTQDVRDFDIDDFLELHAFYVHELTKSLKRLERTGDQGHV